MDKYFPVGEKFDFNTASSNLAAKGYVVVFNWKANPVMKAGKPHYPIVGVALLSRDTFMKLVYDYPLPERFKSDAWFANLDMGTTEELENILTQEKTRKSENKKEEVPVQGDLFSL